MAIPLFSTITEEDKTTAIEKLIEQSSPRQDFFVMMVLSVMLATLGLILNNVAIIIGSMLVAPILYPILSLSMGVVMADTELIKRSLQTFLKGFSVALIASAATALLFSSFIPGINEQIAERTQATVPHVMVAILAGIAASLAFVKPNLNEMLPGVAIAVALVPPLASIGVGIAIFDFAVIGGALLLFVINSIGIVTATIVVFSLMNFYVKKDDTKKIVDKEDREIEQERKQAATDNE